ncbi:MAG: cation acetate symporter [Acidimicrobiia bacterium]|nr:cation acetate symporter [Acidimicrobiia bacterium]
MTLTTVFVAAVIVATFTIGLFGVRIARTTSDFFVATRAVGSIWNASAISGEYLSAASFLGIAGLVMKYGAKAMWFPLGYAAGYVTLLLFVAAPLRRFGAYTIPDFAEGRFASRSLRRIAALMVLVIGWFYLIPQMKGAGVTLELLAGVPYWVGVVVVGVLVIAAVAFGGMKGITYVQAFHFWTKLTAISFVALAMLIILGFSTGDRTPFADGLPTFPTDTEVTFARDTRLQVPQSIVVILDGAEVAWSVGSVEVAGGTKVGFSAGDVVPSADPLGAVDGTAWTVPFPEGERYGLLGAVSLVVATVLGTMGLPHILVRFYTNRDAPSARRTAVVILAFVGVFYLFPWIFGVLGRVWVPELYVTGDTDTVVLVLPQLVDGLLGSFLSALVAAGAFSAFISTSSGLLISVAGALSHDLYAQLIRPEASASRRLWYFRSGAVIGGLVAILLGLVARPYDINILVGWAFAIAASAFCPLLILGIWWRRLAARGAALGMLTGGLAATAAILTTMLGDVGGLAGALLAQPAVVTVPLSFAVMILVSLRSRPPRHADLMLLRMHLPERAARKLRLVV